MMFANMERTLTFLASFAQVAGVAHALAGWRLTRRCVHSALTLLYAVGSPKTDVAVLITLLTLES